MSKIDFIICYSNEECMKKCIACINELIIPDGFEIDILSVYDAENIAEAYNAIIQESNAKYKVYLYENIYIVKKDFLCECIDIFDKNKNIGMIGVLGEKQDSHVLYGEWNVGKLAICNATGEKIVSGMNDKSGTLVDNLNGCILVTQYDAAWDSLTEGNNGYFDIHHSKLLRQANYDLFVPYQEECWCIYEMGCCRFERLDTYTVERGCRYILPDKYGDKPMVSVLLPVYNSEKFLEKTIESVLNQTYNNLQFIIVDDCSKDTSRTIISRYESKDNRIETIFLEQNDNVCNAVNIAFSKASGKYIALIAHDDIWVSNKLELQINYMELFPETGFTFTLCDIIDEKDEICSKAEGKGFYDLFNQRNRSEKKWMDLLFFKGNTFCAASCVLRKDLICGDIYLYSSLQLQDYALWLELLTKSELFIIQDRLTLYRYNFSEIRNLSAPTMEKRIRSSHEELYIKERLLRKISNEQFERLFGHHFIKKGVHSESELKCEKAFILKKAQNSLYLFWFMELFNDNECRNILQNEFSLSLNDFYAENSKGAILDDYLIRIVNGLNKLMEEKE